MRDVKRGNPSATLVLQYDKLYVNHRCFVWNDVQGKVTEHLAVSIEQVYGAVSDILISRGKLMETDQDLFLTGLLLSCHTGLQLS